MREKVLIIGGAGYIGTVLAQKVIRQGNDVTIYDNLTHGPNPLGRLDMVLSGYTLSDALRVDVTASPLKPSRSYRFVEGDTRDKAKVEAVIGGGATHVFHLGELVGVSACETSPELTREVNFVGSKNIVDAVLASPHQPILYWNSSSSVYKISPDGSVFTEASKLPDPSSLDNYCRNKVLVEKYILEKSQESHDFKWMIFRPATVGGLSPRMRIELLPNHIAYSLLTTGKFALANPRDCRAVVDIQDITDFYASLIGTDKWTNGVFNLGKLNASKQEYVLGICELVGLGNEAILQVAEAGDLRNLTISSGLASQQFGYSPSRGLTEMISPLVSLVRTDPFIFARVSGDPLLVDPEFTNTPPREFKGLLMTS